MCNVLCILSLCRRHSRKQVGHYNDPISQPGLPQQPQRLSGVRGWVGIYDIWCPLDIVQCTAVDFVHGPQIGPKQTGSIPLLSLASASAIVWVPPRPIDCLGLGMRGDMLSTGHRNDPKNTNISMIQVLHGCEFIYLCRLLCLIFDGKKHLKYEWITCKGWIFHHTFELLPTSHLKVHLIVHAANLASEKNLGKNELLVVPPMQRMNLLAPYIWVSTHLANIQTARWKLSHSITQINSKAEIDA